jgi:uncharacterized cupredoxin-like copper-binding protein
MLSTAVVLGACGADAEASGGGGGEVLGPGTVTVELDVEHSRFTPERIRVVEGTEVRFVVDNGDPIGHELIVGDEDVHATHEAGTHAQHPAVPGEVSVGSGEQAETTFRFDEPGTVEFACHLPRHYDFGMHGEVVVEPA